MITNKLYIGNLYCMCSKQQLRTLFSQYGRVRGIDMIEGTGFGFVEMSQPSEARKASKALDGTEFLERMIKVRLAGSQPLAS
jgi:RNA recognition motif-containing protein